MARIQQSRSGRRIRPRRLLNSAELKRGVDAALEARGTTSQPWNSGPKPPPPPRPKAATTTNT